MNNSPSLATYVWDFCAGGLHAPVSNFSRSVDVSGSSFTLGFDVAYDSTTSSWIALVTQRQNNALLLLNYGNSLDNAPSTEIILQGGDLLNPDKVQIIYEEGLWYAFVTTDRAPYNLIRLNFGESLSTLVSHDNLGNPNSVLERPRAIAYLRDRNNDLHLILANFLTSEIVKIDFGQSASNSIGESSTQVLSTGYSEKQIFDLDVVRSCDQWYIFAPLTQEGKLIQISLDDDLNVVNSVPQEVLTIEELYYSIQINHDGVGLRGFLMNASGALATLDLGNSVGDGYDLVQTANTINKDGAKIIRTVRDISGNWHLFALDGVTSDLLEADFLTECTVENYVSQSREPQFGFQVAGQYVVSLSTTDPQGAIAYSHDTVFVRNSTSPEIDIQITSDNRCVSSSTSFVAMSNAEADIVEYLWDFGDGTPVVMGKEVSHQYTSEGNYEVVLNIQSASGCGNSVAEEVVIFNELGFSTTQTICTDGPVDFINSNTLSQADTIEWYWDFNGEGNSSEANPSFVFSTPGSKLISLAASIPGCTETYDTTINVLPGPTVAFAPPAQLCAGETIMLENNSSGENISGYQWTFGDGGSLETTTSEAVTYSYSEAGTYEISLTANTTLGCANTVTQTVTVYEQPSVGFSSDVACVGAATLFSDTTTAGSSANIIAWNWDFGDGAGTSEVRNPTYAYSNPGTYTVELSARSSAGCVSSATQTITVETPVAPGFSAARACADNGELLRYQFEDTSQVAGGEEIIRWLWTINDQNFVDRTVDYAFEQAGTYEVTLTTFATSGCNATISRTVVIDDLPTVQFQAATGCVGEPIEFINSTQLNGWEASRYHWEIPTVGSVYEPSPTIVFPEAGEFPIRLTAETPEGCAFTYDSVITVREAPLAAFDLSTNSGGAPLILTTTNRSAHGTTLQWLIDGELVSVEHAPELTFPETGTYELALVVQNSIGCADTAREVIEVVDPVWDLALQEVLITEQEGAPGSLILTLHNQGTLPIDTVDVLIHVGDVVSLEEQILSPILPGKRLTYPLKTSLGAARNLQSPVNYICTSVAVRGATAPEADSLNNRACLTLTSPLQLESPYPNPSAKRVDLSILLKEPAPVQIRMITAGGILQQTEFIAEAKAGLNSYSLDVSQIPAGTYTIEVSALGYRVIKRIVVTP